MSLRFLPELTRAQPFRSCSANEPAQTLIIGHDDQNSRVGGAADVLADPVVSRFSRRESDLNPSVMCPVARSLPAVKNHRDAVMPMRGLPRQLLKKCRAFVIPGTCRHLRQRIEEVVAVKEIGRGHVSGGGD